MKILITNDDGIQAKGLIPLVRWAQKLGEVTVAAPKFEQSGKSHGINILHPFEVKQVELVPGVPAYSVDSTPADCVRFAVLGLKEQFDLVISGINRGLNIGTDIMYSGTVAAVFEAANLGLKAIALSTTPAYYDQALDHLDEIFAFVRDNSLLDKNGIYNINIPKDAGQIRITRQGGPYYSDDFPFISEDVVKPQGKCVYVDSGTLELDTDCTMHGCISVTPLTTNRTNMDVFHDLTHLNP